MNLLIYTDDGELRQLLRSMLAAEMCFWKVDWIVSEQVLNPQEKFHLCLFDVTGDEELDNAAADRLRKNSPDGMIIFIGIEKLSFFFALRYRPSIGIQRAMTQVDVQHLSELIQFYRESEFMAVSLETENGFLKFPIENILFFESDGHYLNIITENQKFRKRGKLQDYETATHFIRIHAGFLVNMNYISVFEKDAVVLKNGKKLPVSRKKAMAAKMRYKEFLTMF